MTAPKNVLDAISTVVDYLGASAVPEASAVTPGPGIFPDAPTAVTPWPRNPGADWTEGETAFDNVTRAKELAAQGRNSAGTIFVAPQDLELAREIACFLIADSTTAEQAEAKVKNSTQMDADAAAYCILTGGANHFPADGAGRPEIFNTSRGPRIIDVIKKAGKIVGGNVAGA